LEVDPVTTTSLSVVGDVGSAGWLDVDAAWASPPADACGAPATAAADVATADVAGVWATAGAAAEAIRTAVEAEPRRAPIRLERLSCFDALLQSFFNFDLPLLLKPVARRIFKVVYAIVLLLKSELVAGSLGANLRL
jgi:hypothetical protein